MKRMILTILVILAAFATVGCQTSSRSYKNKEKITDELNYVFDEQRINRIYDMCMLTINMLDDESIPVSKLKTQLSETADTLELVVRHCPDLDFNLWVRGYLRHISSIVLDKVEIKEGDDYVAKLLFLPYDWTIIQTDSIIAARTNIFRNSQEVYDRNATVLLASMGGQRKCLFEIYNFSDTVINDLNIVFVDANEREVFLRPTDSDVESYMNSEDGIVRVVFPWERVWPLLTGSEVMRITYEAKDEQILMVLPMSFKSRVDSLFGAVR